MSNQQMIQQEPWNQQEKSVPVAAAYTTKSCSYTQRANCKLSKANFSKNKIEPYIIVICKKKNLVIIFSQKVKANNN